MYTSADVAVAMLSTQALVLIFGYYSDEELERNCQTSFTQEITITDLNNSKSNSGPPAYLDGMFQAAWILLAFAWAPLFSETYELISDKLDEGETWPYIVIALVSFEAFLFCTFGCIQFAKCIFYCTRTDKTATYEQHVLKTGFTYELYMAIVSVCSKALLSVLITWLVINRESTMSSNTVNYYVGYLNSTSARCTT